MIAVESRSVTCDECGSAKWRAGPKGGLAQNWRCENNHTWVFYYFPFWTGHGDKVWYKERAESRLKRSL